MACRKTNAQGSRSNPVSAKKNNNFDTLARARALARVPYDADRGLTPSRPPNGPLYGPTSDLGNPRVDIR